MSETTKKLGELKQLASKVGPNIYRRLQLTVEVLSDREWLVSSHEGDYDAAEQALADDYFPDLKAFKGGIGIWLDVFRKFPDEKVWKNHSYQLQGMKALYDEVTCPDPPPPPTNWKQKCKELEAEVFRLNDQIAVLKEARENDAKEKQSLCDENTELRAEVSNLRGRLGELEKVLDRYLQKQK